MSLGQIRRKLVDEREELVARLERTHKHIYQKQEPVSASFADQSVEMDNQQLVYALDSEGRQVLGKIDRAIARIDKGCYGFCTHCGEEISEARLLTLAHTDLCITCASEEI